MPPIISLPPPPTFLDSLLASFSNTPPYANDPSWPIPTKPILLTLHALFPTTLLPALDVLDRRLITKLTLSQEAAINTDSSDHNTTTPPSNTAINAPPPQTTIYYVRSNAPTHSTRGSGGRYNTAATDFHARSYEVRTTAWNCTCAAFTFAAFSHAMSLDDRSDLDHDHRHRNEDESDGGEVAAAIMERGCCSWGKRERERWGGLMLRGDGDEVPICKHLLACVLAERWDVAEAMVEERVVGRGEMAGWAAGWAD